MISWTNSGSNTSQNSSYTATCLPLQTIQIRRTRHAGHCWKSKDELISNVLLWTTTHGHTSVDQSAKTCLSSVRTQNTAEKIYQERCLIGMNGKRETENSVLSVWLGDMYRLKIYLYGFLVYAASSDHFQQQLIYIYIYIYGRCFLLFSKFPLVSPFNLTLLYEANSNFVLSIMKFQIQLVIANGQSILLIFIFEYFYISDWNWFW